MMECREIYAKLMPELAAPLHDRCLRVRKAAGPGTADLERGYDISGDERALRDLGAALPDFERFMNVVMETPRHREGYAIRALKGAPQGCPAKAPEAYGLDIGPKECRITFEDVEGLRRALIHLEDEMLVRRSPHLPLGKSARWAVVEERIVRSPLAPNRWESGWELEDETDYYPDEYLNRLAHCGINGLWVTGLYRNLIASKVLPELGPPEHCLAKLKLITERAARYGIKVFFFCIEPRSVPDDHPALMAHPEICGARMYEFTTSLCTSTPLVQKYVAEATASLLQEVPLLGGIINIFNGERGTTCWHNALQVQRCPRCRARPQAEVLAEDLNLFARGIKAAGSRAKLIAWTYAMEEEQDSMCARPVGPMLKVMQSVDKAVVWMTNFEHGGHKTVGGSAIDIQEYSLSYIGPSADFVRTAEAAAENGLFMYAKLQIGTTYEMPALPYLPLPGNVYDKLAAMRRLGVKGAMVNWLIGGYPGLMLKAMGEASFETTAEGRRDFMQRLAGLYWDQGVADKVVLAWEHFQKALAEFPCINQVLYYSPLTRSPAYHLHLEKESRLALPYNWGYDTERNPQPHEDGPARWQGQLKSGEIISLFRSMADEWQKGLQLLRAARDVLPADKVTAGQYAVAAAARLQFLSAANVYEFYTLRAELRRVPQAGQSAVLQKMCRTAENDIVLAEAMKDYLKTEPFIGFHSEMYDYSFTEELLDKKIEQVRHTLFYLDRWQSEDVEEAVLDKDLAARGRMPSFRGWLECGDDCFMD
ncbi:MAG: hypothetical protein Q8O57_01790 [Kiritimatiellota bacterium]|nr:hypothetical protein [Kiritimatiellota bacterium]